MSIIFYYSDSCIVVFDEDTLATYCSSELSIVVCTDVAGMQAPQQKSENQIAREELEYEKQRIREVRNENKE